MEFTFKFTEIVTKYEKIEADNLEEAINEANRMYDCGEVDMMKDVYMECDISPVT